MEAMQYLETVATRAVAAKRRLLQARLRLYEAAQNGDRVVREYILAVLESSQTEMDLLQELKEFSQGSRGISGAFMDWTQALKAQESGSPSPESGTPSPDED